jgi:crotonobetainyl-CoA:carnitine CoA-transferase CaiB-like acyl-CoA transferase
MFETMASFMLVERANGAMFDLPLGPAIYPRTVAPNRRPYRTSDGYIAVLIYNDRHSSAFVNAVQPPWASDLYSTLERRAPQIDTVYGLVAETLKERTTDEPVSPAGDTRGPAADTGCAVRRSSPERNRLFRDAEHPTRAGALSRRADLVFPSRGPSRRSRSAARRRYGRGARRTRARCRCRSGLDVGPILLLHAELPRGSIFRLPSRRVCR